MFLSKIWFKVARVATVMGVVVVTLFAVGSVASASNGCTASPTGGHCSNGHPWNN